MDTFLIILGALLTLAGIIGCIIPVLPGPVLNFLGLLALHLTDQYELSTQVLVMDAVLAVLINLVENLAPIYFTNRYGGTQYGTWGAAIGVIFGIFLLPPIGLILGPFLGAFIGELIAGKEGNQAFRAAFGTFIGFVAGTLMKLAVSLFITYHFLEALFW